MQQNTDIIESHGGNKANNRLKLLVLRTIIYLTVFFTASFGLKHYLNGIYNIAAFEAAVCILLLTLLHLPATRYKAELLSIVFSFIIIIFLLYLTYYGVGEGSASMWSLVFVPAVFFMLGNKKGLLFNITLLIALAVLMISSQAEYKYTSTFNIRFFGVFIMLMIVGFAYETVRSNIEQNLNDQITAKTRAQQNLVKAKLEAESANHTKSVFLANMSHEIRTPLNAIIGAVYLLLEKEKLKQPEPDDSNHERFHYLNLVNRSSRQLLDLLNNVLDITRAEAGMLALDHAPFDLKASVSEMLATYKEEAIEKGLTLEVQFDHSIPKSLTGDINRIQQIIVNLVSNAIKYTRSGNILVVLGVEKISYERARLKISVSDTGIGIPEELQKNLFTRFYKYNIDKNRQFDGAGLGLSIVDTLVQSMQGSIIVTSPSAVFKSGPTPGTDIHVTLKLTTDTSEIDTSPIEKTKRPTGEIINNPDTTEKNILANNPSILLVDDNAINRLIAKKQLESMLATVDTATSGEQAIDKCRGQRYDLILMDLHMPGIDGVTAAKEILKLHPQMPIVALTAESRGDQLKDTLASGMVAHLVKPVHHDELYRCIKNNLK